MIGAEVKSANLHDGDVLLQSGDVLLQLLPHSCDVLLQSGNIVLCGEIRASGDCRRGRFGLRLGRACLEQAS